MHQTLYNLYKPLLYDADANQYDLITVNTAFGWTFTLVSGCSKPFGTLQRLQRILERGGTAARHLSALLRAFVTRQPYAALCRRVLSPASDAALLRFATCLLRLHGGGLEDGSAKGGLQALIFGRMRWRTLDDLLLFNAATLAAPQLVRALAEEEGSARQVVRTLKHHISAAILQDPPPSTS